jgi:hypothetical protein
MPTVNYREVLIEKRGGKGDLSKRGVDGETFRIRSRWLLTVFVMR